jgi:clan AA aspartic protease
MGLTYIDGVARGPTGKEEPVRFLVDSGATYSLLPNSVWEALGLEPTREMTFTLADGTMVQRRISECYLVLPQWETHTPVILGEPGDEALLGLVTLEELGLVLNPFNRTLQPLRLMLA